MRNDVLGCVEILVLSVFTWFISAWLENTIYLLLASLILLFFRFFCMPETHFAVYMLQTK